MGWRGNAFPARADGCDGSPDLRSRIRGRTGWRTRLSRHQRTELPADRAGRHSTRAGIQASAKAGLWRVDRQARPREGERDFRCCQRGCCSALHDRTRMARTARSAKLGARTGRCDGGRFRQPHMPHAGRRCSARQAARCSRSFAGTGSRRRRQHGHDQRGCPSRRAGPAVRWAGAGGRNPRRTGWRTGARSRPCSGTPRDDCPASPVRHVDPPIGRQHQRGRDRLWPRRDGLFARRRT